MAMPYLLQVVNEVKRLCPIVPAVFGNTQGRRFELDGVTVPAGWMVMWAVTPSHIAHGVYSDATRFDPDRFSPSAPRTNATSTPSCRRAPGPVTGHRCPGLDFATFFMEVFAVGAAARLHLGDPAAELRAGLLDRAALAAGRVERGECALISFQPKGNRVREIDKREIVEVEVQLRTDRRQFAAKSYISFVDRLPAGNRGDLRLGSQPVAYARHCGFRIVIVPLNILPADVRKVLLIPKLLGIENQEGLAAVCRAEGFRDHDRLAITRFTASSIFFRSIVCRFSWKKDPRRGFD